MNIYIYMTIFMNIYIYIYIIYVYIYICKEDSKNTSGILSLARSKRYNCSRNQSQTSNRNSTAIGSLIIGSWEFIVVLGGKPVPLKIKPHIVGVQMGGW